MHAALFITLLALVGVSGGMMLDNSSALLSGYVASIGGGVLSGIALFWLLPEVAEHAGWIAAALITLAACMIFALLDRLFVHSATSPIQKSVGPLLAATAIHSFIDGWSISALETFQIAKVTAPIGLALHKIPEGVAVGWISRRRLPKLWQAGLLGAGVELVTLLGAWIEPAANRSAFAAFGSWWTSGLVALISGSFLFFGLHAILPNRRHWGALAAFFTTLLLVGLIGLLQAGGI